MRPTRLRTLLLVAAVHLSAPLAARPGWSHALRAPRPRLQLPDAEPSLPEPATAEEAAAQGENAESNYNAQDYLSSLSRFADDERPLLHAPQRYSSRQWRDNILSVKTCSLLRAVRAQLLWQILWSFVVSMLFMASRGALPTLPALPHSLLGGTLGVLLGFRTNQSYDRFWEGRKLWGNVFTSCRNLNRMALVCIDNDPVTYEKIVRHLKAYPVALKQHLRGEFDMSEFGGTLETAELNELAAADNLPISVCTTLSMAINELKLADPDTQSAGPLTWWGLEDQVNMLTGITSDCERLVRTPVPLAYAVHTSRLLSLWVGSLPFVLVGCFAGARRLLTAPLTAFVAWALFCTEELGHIIEEPFGAFDPEHPEARLTEVLPLDRYCTFLQEDLEKNSMLRKRALRKMEEDPVEEADAEPEPLRGEPDKEAVSEEEAMEIAYEAQRTVEAVEAEQAAEAEGFVKPLEEAAVQEEAEATKGVVEPTKGPVKEYPKRRFGQSVISRNPWRPT